MLIIILLLSGHKTHLATDSVAHTYRELERESNNKRGFFSSSLSPRRCYCIVVVVGSVLSFKVQNKSECGVLFCPVNYFCVFANFPALLLCISCCFLSTVAFFLLCKLKFSKKIQFFSLTRLSNIVCLCCCCRCRLA